MRDTYHNVLVTQHLNPVVSTATKTSTAIDLQGYNSASVVFAIGLAGDTLSGSVLWTLKLQHSDDDSSYADLAAADIYGGTTSIVLDAMTKDEAAYSFGYIGTKRFLKAVATPTGTHTNGTPIGVEALRGTPAYAPVA
jgi:hypothetical protein